ncbi:MAG: CHAT domain-containing protein [Candidatus Eremiobacteraeota bacterium]|nr:CHAT domain-containing protein [Candidatus Eremiobacteraeota bacterium]
MNLVRIVRSLLSDSDWTRTPAIFDLRVFAPHWSDVDLQSFVERPISPSWLDNDPFPATFEAIRSLRAVHSPLDGTAASDEVHYDIIYTTSPERLATMSLLPVALLGAQTRLLIVHESRRSREPFAVIDHLGDRLVRVGFPAFLWVGTENTFAADHYFANFFGGITHDEPLEELIPPVPGADVMLVAADGSSSLLSLQEHIAELRDEISRKLEDATKVRYELLSRQPLLHRFTFSTLIDQTDAAIKPLLEHRDQLKDIASSGWLHEGEGIIPLAEVQRAVAAAPPPPEVTIKQPRVLNAAVETNDGDVAASAALRPGVDYRLAVQIGPRWAERVSLVGGAADFPERALADGGGHMLDVVLVGEDLEPRLTEAPLWLPTSGPSGPKAGSEEPVQLPFRIRERGRADDDLFEARLIIYYHNTVLQSATVSGSIATADVPPTRRLSIVVDYAVTGSFTQVEKFAMRELRTATGEVEALSVGLSLVRNGNGTRHRIVAKGTDVPAAWRSYDPQGNTATLALARGALLSRLKSGAGDGLATLRADLDALATIGATLYHKAFTQIDGSTDTQWASYLQRLAAALRSKTVIQIATSGLTQYVFPWALLYDYPMDRPDTRRYCDLVVKNEWDQAPRDRCPYDDQDWHEANVLCPYGFWGFRHVIEQPLSALPPDHTDVLAWGERRQPTLAGIAPALTVGVTRDPAITQAVDAHLQDLAKFGAVTPDRGAVAWSTVEGLLRDAEVLYFLCHGRRDDQRLESYIAIGVTGDTVEERVYPSGLLDWARRRGNTVPALQRAPFVMINGCHTAALTADDLVNFVQNLAGIGASAVIGTEVSVPVDFATAFALGFLQKVTQAKLPVGQAMYETRWDFARRGNLLGLIYTPYCFADVAIS